MRGEYLDNIGALVGIERPVRDTTTGYLKTDDFQNIPDYSKYFVVGTDTTGSYKKVDDAYFRMLIRAQIIKNSSYTFSHDDIESFCKYIFSNERFTTMKLHNIVVDTGREPGGMGITTAKTHAHMFVGVEVEFTLEPPFVEIIPKVGMSEAPEEGPMSEHEHELLDFPSMKRYRSNCCRLLALVGIPICMRRKA